VTTPFERRVRAAGRLVRAVAARTRPPIGAAFVEQPAPGPVPGGPIDIVAWVASRHPGPWTVVLTVDGVAAAVARIGRRRPDVVGAHPWAADAAEVRAALTPEAGWRRVGVALAAPGRPLVELTSVNIDVEPSPRAVGGIDEPANGTEVPADFVPVRGWAWTARGAASAVELHLGGKPAGRARPGVARDDVAAALGDPLAVAAGFEALVDLRAAAPGRPVALTAVVRALDGTATSLREVSVGPVPVPFLARAAPLSGAGRAKKRGRRATPALVVLTHDLSVGGAQRFVGDVVSHRIASGDPAPTVIAGRDGAWREALEQAGAQVHVSGCLRIESAAAYEGAVAELQSWLDGREPHLVLASTLNVFPMVDAVRRLGASVVWALHEHLDPDAHLTLSTPGHRPDPYVRERMHAALADATTVFASDSTRTVYRDVVDPARAHVVPYGLRLASSRVERRTASGDVPGREFTVLCVGRFEPRKAQTRLVEAVAALRDELPGLRLVLLGAGRDDTSAAVRALVAAHDLPARVRVEPVGPPDEWYGRADVCVSASDLESLPYVVLEAMAHGVPVAAAAVAGVPDVVHDGDTGVLFEPNDLASLVGAICRMHALGGAEREAMGARGRALVEARHRAEDALAAVDALLR
jgi:D-inositol-3-phosphate glycosyltransferase